MTGCRLSANLLPRPTSTHTAAIIFRARTCGRPRRENKRPQPQSACAGSLQTLVGTLNKTSQNHENTPRRAPQSAVFWYIFRTFSLKVFQGFGAAPQSAKKTQTRSPTEATMAPRSAKLEPRSPPKYQGYQHVLQIPNMSAQVPQ